MRLVLCLFAIIVMIVPASATQNELEDQAAARSEAAIGNLLPPSNFVDTQGRQVTLEQLRGKPVLISMVYTGCTDVCPAIIENLRPAIEIGQDALGADSFTTITVGFDTRHDTPERMRSFARARGIDLPNWLFVSGDQQTVQRLADAVGFTITPSAGGFDHTAQVSIVDADGRIYQQIRGGVFNPPAIVEPLKDLMFGRRQAIVSLGGITERIKLFCTVYNPNTGRYYFNYSLFIGLGIGIACLLLVLIWLVREFRLPGGDAHP
ncbi:MAG: SCO family protein [Hyphomicrobiales bacterium]|nr:SCO family protein [Hyphomicrobiales bacterium]